MTSNAKALYDRIQENPEHTQALFRQALQDPQGALRSICDFGESIGLPVTSNEVKQYLAEMDDTETKQWIVKARGGL